MIVVNCYNVGTKVGHFHQNNMKYVLEDFEKGDLGKLPPK